MPLLAAAIWFALGELLAHHWLPAILLLTAFLLMVVLTALTLHRCLRIAVIPLAGVWMVVGMWSAEVQPVPSQQTTLLHYADGLSRQVHGSVMRVRLLPPRTAMDSAIDLSRRSRYGQYPGT